MRRGFIPTALIAAVVTALTLPLAANAAPPRATTRSVTGPGTLSVTLRARACSGSVLMRVTLDGRRISNRRVTGTVKLSSELGSGKHQLVIKVMNPSSRATRCQRALSLVSQKVTPPANSAPETKPVTAPVATPAPTPTPPVSTHSYPHVVWIMMENKSYGEVIGSAQAPYINSLAASYGLAGNFFGETHPSLPNYIAASSGSTQGIVDNGDPAVHPLSAPSIFGQVAHRTYAESMPSPCYRISTGEYAVRHNPETYFTNLPGCSLDNVSLPSNPSFEQPLTMIVPNLCHDMHASSCGPDSAEVRRGDDFLSGLVPKVIASPQYQAGQLALFIAWDEDNYNSGQHTVALVISPTTSPGTLAAARYDHYSMLRTTEELLGLPLLGEAATAPSMRTAFGL